MFRVKKGRRVGGSSACVCVKERETLNREKKQVIKTGEWRWCVRYSPIYDLQKCCWSQYYISIHQYRIQFPRDGNKAGTAVIYTEATQNTI
jgi:hypothetical protein